jgi:hypothetical protein
MQANLPQGYLDERGVTGRGRRVARLGGRQQVHGALR